MMTKEKAIERITNLAQENNINWLGETNIEAMKILLSIVQPSLDDLFNQINEISREVGFDADLTLKSYREIKCKAAKYDEIEKIIKE